MLAWIALTALLLWLLVGAPTISAVSLRLNGLRGALAQAQSRRESIQSDLYRTRGELRLAEDALGALVYPDRHKEVSGMVIARAGRARAYRRYDRDSVAVVRRGV